MYTKMCDAPAVLLFCLKSNRLFFFYVLVAVDLMIHDDNNDDDDGCDDEWFDFYRYEIWFFFIASNLQIEIIILITFLGQFACAWI